MSFLNVPKSYLLQEIFNDLVINGDLEVMGDLLNYYDQKSSDDRFINRTGDSMLYIFMLL